MLTRTENIKSKSRLNNIQNKKNTLFIQPKLKVGMPDDKYEVEADRVAEQVVKGSAEQSSFFNQDFGDSFFNSSPGEGNLNRTILFEGGERSEENQNSSVYSKEVSIGDNIVSNRVQEKCSECEEEETLQEKSEEEISPTAQTGNSDQINMYPNVDCDEGEILDRAQTVVWFQHNTDDFRSDSEVNSYVHFMRLLHEVQNFIGMTGTDGVILIHGYASEEGGASHNLTLSLQRAIKVRDLLVALGIPANQLIPVGHGENTDYETLEYNRRVEVTFYPTATCMEFDPLPVSGSVTTMHCDDGRNINNNGDHDLDKLIHRPDDRSPDIWVYDSLLGENGAYSDFQIGFFAGTFGVDTSDDNRLFDNFTTGSGTPIDFNTGSDMAREIGGTDAFSDFANTFEDSVRNYFNQHHTLHGFDCQAELIRTRPNYIGGSDSLFSWAVMGGYQRLEVNIDLSDGDLDITYRVFDHYGAGVSDAWSYLPGLSAMYYLQHYVSGSSNTYVPFIWSVSINRTGNL
ncbi:OmpA family protein [Maribellus comscasis]|uniref:OmpA family protein n=1 Tax=Maribellus comscasis TaxID=2681766 RepID=A0A6I6KA72_9BACT|nr:OmpA family protein [Maribellus comscasis]QGY47054.1 OmpA family protein [Maribellus comscasis]